MKDLTGGYKIKYHSNGLDSEPIEIDFTPPFRYACFPSRRWQYRSFIFPARMPRYLVS